MKADLSLLLIVLLFLAASAFITRGALTAGGFFQYRDTWTLISLDSFKEYFFYIQNPSGQASLDLYKRIPETWIHFFMDYEQYGKVQFGLLSFCALISMFFVSEKILQNEAQSRTHGGDQGRAHGTTQRILSAAVAFAYLLNPFSLQLILEYYSMIVYAIFPVFFYLLYEGFAKSKTKSTVAAALLGAFMFLMVVHSVMYCGMSVLIVLAISALRKTSIRSMAASAVLFSLVFLALTSFAWFPYLAGSQTSSIEGAHMLSENLLMLFSADAFLPKAMLMDFRVFWWPWVGYAYPGGDAFFLISAVFSSLLFVHAFFDRNDWSKISLLGLAILFFFSKGIGPPFPQIYEYINFHLPLSGWLLRVPRKFLYIIPFFYCLLLLRLLIFASKQSWRLAYALAGAFLIFLAVFSWPFFTGDMGGFLAKQDMSATAKDLSAINAIISPQDSSALAPSRLELVLQADSILQQSFLLGELASYGKMSEWSGLKNMAPSIGAGYLVSGSSEGLKGIFPEAYAGSDLFLFKLRPDDSQAVIPSAAVLCYCDFETARSLIRDPPADALPGALIFPYQLKGAGIDALGSADYVVVGPASPLITNAEAKNIISFSKSTFLEAPSINWSRAILSRYWPPQGRSARLSFMESDFGEGFVYIDAQGNSAMENISSPFLVSDDGEYEVYLRYYKNSAGGAIKTYLDGAYQTTIPTRSISNDFFWASIYNGSLGKGSHTFTVQQINGSNALNIGYFRKKGSIGLDLSNKTIIYRLTATDFYDPEWSELVSGNASSTFNYLNASYSLKTTIEVFESGTYEVSKAIIGNATLKIDRISVENGSVYLEKGEHDILIVHSGSMLVD